MNTETCSLCHTCKVIKEKRSITSNNHTIFNISDAKYEQFHGTQPICTKCRSKYRNNLYQKRCPVPKCKTPLRKLLFRKIIGLPKEIYEAFGISTNVCKVCNSCHSKILRYTCMKSKIGQKNRTTESSDVDISTGSPSDDSSIMYVNDSNPMRSSDVDISTGSPSDDSSIMYVNDSNHMSTFVRCKGGRPGKPYSQLKLSSQRALRAKAKDKFKTLIVDLDDISNGEGEQLFQTIVDGRKETKQQLNDTHNTAKRLATSYESEKPGSNGRVRLLSTVATELTNKELKEIFKCSDYEITRARVHAHTYGPGATAEQKKNNTTKYRLPEEELAFVISFLHHPDNTERSSHRMASCEGKHSSWISDLFGGGHQPVMWLKDGIKHLYDKYKLECQKEGRSHISESTFRKGLQAGNFKEMVEMFGLCNICDEYGERNWQNLQGLVEELRSLTLINMSNACSSTEANDDAQFQMLQIRIKRLKGHLLSEFSTNLLMHSECASHCMQFNLVERPQCSDHSLSCEDCSDRFSLFDDIAAVVSTLDEELQQKVDERLTEMKQHLALYVGHLIRGKFQRHEFLNEISTLETGKTVAVCDYMMKLLLQKFREPQKDWYGKKGVSVHGTMFFYKDQTSIDNEITVEIHDVFSNGDCTQNCFFSASALEATCLNFAKLHPEITKMAFWSDNGPHYHNTSLILWLPIAMKSVGMTLLHYSFFEAQKGKTALDTHFATFKFILKAWRKRGNDMLSSEDIIDGTVGHLKGTHVYEIFINRAQEPPSAKTLAGINNFGYFDFCYDESGELLSTTVQEQTGLGKTKKFCQEQMVKLWPKVLQEHKGSTGVISNYNPEVVGNVKPLTKKQSFYEVASNKSKKTEVEGCKVLQSNKSTTQENNFIYKCKECEHAFLRKGNLNAHLLVCNNSGSVTAPQSHKINTHKQAITKTGPKMSDALSSAHFARSLQVTKEEEKATQERLLHEEWMKRLKGSSSKLSKPPRKRSVFTKMQKKIMIDCFEEGEKQKKNRVPVNICQEKMMSVGEGSLTVQQITSFWSMYKGKRRSTTTCKEE